MLVGLSYHQVHRTERTLSAMIRSRPLDLIKRFCTLISNQLNKKLIVGGCLFVYDVFCMMCTKI